MRRILLASAALLLAGAPLAAQLSRPQAPVPIAAPEPSRDVPFPGTIELEVTVDPGGIFRVRQRVPVTRAGLVTLRYPRFLPGNHGPTGPIEAVAGLRFEVEGEGTLRWLRDPIDNYSFHVEVPEGVRSIVASFDYLSNTAGAINRTEATPSLLNVQWEKVSLYPAGHYVRQISVRPTLIVPEGFTAVSAIDGQPRRGRIVYQAVDYETLVDSPVFAGRHFRAWDLGQNVDLNVFADAPEDLAAAPEMIEAHRRLVEQSLLLFGGRRFDRYDFLLALSDELSGIGLEHHRSSENAVGRNYFRSWATRGDDHTLLPHEFVHSWNGKYRRPAGLWAPDYSYPTRNNLLWLYEGQTSFWHYVLGARSGLITPEAALAEIAGNAAYYQAQAGRRWRSLEDTTFQPNFAYRRPLEFSSWQRGTDYYSEAALVWLEADMLIRDATGGRRSLDDFARIFFAGREGDYGVSTYGFDDVVAAMDQVHRHDWRALFHERVQTPGAPPPLRGVELGGYRLVFREEPNVLDRPGLAGGLADLRFSLGVIVARGGRIAAVLWDSPAARQGLRPGATIVSVDGRPYSSSALLGAVTAGKGGTPIRLAVRHGSVSRQIAFDYRGGLRFPHLERVGAAPTHLDRLLQPRTR